MVVARPNSLVVILMLCGLAIKAMLRSLEKKIGVDRVDDAGRHEDDLYVVVLALADQGEVRTIADALRRHHHERRRRPPVCALTSRRPRC